MKKQNRNITLLASLVTGLLTLSQGALAAAPLLSSTVDFRAIVSDSTCNVQAKGATSGAAYNVSFGNLSAKDLIAAGTKTVGDGTYHVLTSAVNPDPVIVTVSGCDGAELAKDGTIVMTASGAAAMGTAVKNLYGDATTDNKVGFALSYTLTDKSDPVPKANNDVKDHNGYITPTASTVDLYKATANGTTGDLAGVNVEMAITPEIATWAATDTAIPEVHLSVPVTFTVAMN